MRLFTALFCFQWLLIWKQLITRNTASGRESEKIAEKRKIGSNKWPRLVANGWKANVLTRTTNSSGQIDTPRQGIEVRENRGVVKRHDSSAKTFITLSWTLLSLNQQLEVEELAVSLFHSLPAKRRTKDKQMELKLQKEIAQFDGFKRNGTLKLHFFLHFI